MRTCLLLGLCTALMVPALQTWTAAAADSATAEATLRIQSVRVSRSSAEFTKQFSGRYYSDGSSGVNLQLLLTLGEGTLLPVARDAVSVETFIDDTYQSLLRTGSDSSYSSGSQPTVVSDDGRMLLVTVSSSRIPAEEAGRVFVRGSVEARVNRGKPAVATNQVTLTVGQDVTVGPFRTVIRSVADQGSSGLSVMLSIEGDASRIQKVRVLDTGGQVLNDGRQNRFTDSDLGPGNRPVTTYLNLRTFPKAPVTIEYTYAERTELVRIPFEAQVDIGVAKAGPIEPSGGKLRKTTELRPWPPPRETTTAVLPPARAAFSPTNSPRAAGTRSGITTSTNASIDLFSITVAKPAPSEAKGVQWKAAPAPSVFADGFTVARLLLCTPGMNIVSVPADGITVTRFEDDKGGRLDSSLFRDTTLPPNASTIPFTRVSAEGHQALLNLSLAAAPHPGATRCTIAGIVRAKVTRGDRTNSSASFELQSGREFTAGPFKGTFGAIRQLAPFTPAIHDGTEIEVWLTLSGPLGRVRSVELLDHNQRVLNSNRSGFQERALESVANINYGLRVASAPSGPVTLRICHHETSESIDVPFEFSTGIGL